MLKIRCDYYRVIGIYIGSRKLKIMASDLMANSKYNKETINSAISRAEALEPEPKCNFPINLGSTVYRLLKNIKEIDDQYESN